MSFDLEVAREHTRGPYWASDVQAQLLAACDEIERLRDALEVALELIDLVRNGRTLGQQFPMSREQIVRALENSR